MKVVKVILIGVGALIAIAFVNMALQDVGRTPEEIAARGEARRAADQAQRAADKEAEDKRDVRRNVWGPCHDAVLAKLRAPSTATFPATETLSWNDAVDHAQLQGAVDSQNSFGGTVRTPYVCAASKSKIDGTWTIRGVVFAHPVK